MNISELYKPKLSTSIISAAEQYYKEKLMMGDDNLRKTLSKMGWKYLDEGAFSKVFENPKKNYILKINSSPDVAYARFVDIIHKHRNKHFPKISDMKQIEFENRNYFIYLIEKLNKMPIGSYWNDPIRDIINHPSASLEDLYLNKYGMDAIPEILVKNPSLVSAARILGKNIG